MAKRRASYWTYGRRARRPEPAPFRAWGVALCFMAVLLAASGASTSALFVTALLAFYLLAIRLTRCRVETTQRAPCKWQVRGFVGTCDWHRGLKRGLPHLVQVPRSALPRFMWLRPDLATGPAQSIDPQPAAGATPVAATAPNAARPAYDWAIFAIELTGVVVAIVTLAHEVFSS